MSRTSIFCSNRFAIGFTLASIHPAHGIEAVRDRTGFDFSVSDLCETPVPDAETLALIRNPVARDLAEVYPAFATEILGVSPP
ncbi:MAG: glutaconate CoA-transferase, subunit [Aliidongia sp.]|nr:glutaconate CoA-transferase, subunit [Aliidongia sp.]